MAFASTHALLQFPPQVRSRLSLLQFQSFIIRLFCCVFIYRSLLLLQGSDTWSSTILGVFEDGFATCFMSSWMPCAQHAMNAQRYAQKLDPQASHFLPEAATFCLVGLGASTAICVASHYFSSLSILSWYFPLAALAKTTQVPLRRKVREMYGISESESFCGSDFLAASCCLCCSLIQVSRQLRKSPPNQKR